MPPRSPVRTIAILWSILGLVVALLIHFIVLSSAKYNWLAEPAAIINTLNMGLVYLRSFL